MLGTLPIYTTTADVLDYLRSAYAPNAEVSYDGRFDTLRQARVLALDEFDRWAPTAWAQEKFFQLIDYRYRNADNLLTVFAANSDISILPGYIASRMNDVCQLRVCHVRARRAPGAPQLRRCYVGRDHAGRLAVGTEGNATERGQEMNTPNIAAYPGAAEALWCIERQALQCTRFAALLAYIRALQACQPPVYDASTATANQTYTWLQGDVWSQYCAAVDAQP